MSTTLTHEEATELAGLYVLDALTPAERAEVDTHLASCSKPHLEFDEVGGVVPALATLAESKGAPASLKNKVMADYRAGTGTPAWEPAKVVATPSISTRPVQASWLGWAAAAVAVLLLAVVGGWGYMAQQRADAEAHNSQMLAQAFDVMSAQGSMVAVMKGPAGSGFAAIGKDGGGYLVLTDLPAVPDGMTYQAWYINGADGVSSAGLLTVDSQGLAVLALPTKTGATGVALTVEPAGGSASPTGRIVIKGDLLAHG